MAVRRRRREQRVERIPADRRADAGRHVGRQRRTRSIAGEVERRDEHVVAEDSCGEEVDQQPRPARSGRIPVAVGRFLISTFTRRPGAHVEHLAQRRDSGRAARTSARVRLRQQARPGVAASWRTTSAPSAVRWTSSSTPSAPELHRPRQAGTVFSGARRWRHDGRARASRPGMLRPGRSRHRSVCGKFLVRPLREVTEGSIVSAPASDLEALGNWHEPRDLSPQPRARTGGTGVALTWVRTHEWDVDGVAGRVRPVATRIPTCSSRSGARPRARADRDRPRICAACTVHEECLEFALATNQEAGHLGWHHRRGAPQAAQGAGWPSSASRAEPPAAALPAERQLEGRPLVAAVRSGMRAPAMPRARRCAARSMPPSSLGHQRLHDREAEPARPLDREARRQADAVVDHVDHRAAVRARRSCTVTWPARLAVVAAGTRGRPRSASAR